MIKQTDRHIMEESTIIQKFLDYLKFERRFSEHTAKCYGADLAQFGEFLKGASSEGAEHGEGALMDHHADGAGHGVGVATQVRVEVDQLLLTVKTESVRAYLAHLNEKEYSKATIARKLATLRSFYKFLVKRNHISSNPVVTIRTPKQEKKLPRFLECEEVKRLLTTPPMNTWLGARDRAILETLYSTGIRVSELVALNMEDIGELALGRRPGSSGGTGRAGDRQGSPGRAQEISAFHFRLRVTIN